MYYNFKINVDLFVFIVNSYFFVVKFQHAIFSRLFNYYEPTNECYYKYLIKLIYIRTKNVSICRR